LGNLTAPQQWQNVQFVNHTKLARLVQKKANKTLEYPVIQQNNETDNALIMRHCIITVAAEMNIKNILPPITET